MKKKIAGITVILMLGMLLLSGCKKDVGTPEDNAVKPEETETEEKEAYTFGYTCITMKNNPYFLVLRDAIREEVEREGGTLVVRDPEGDVDTQLAQIDEMIALGVDAVFLSPVDWERIQPGIDALKEAGVKIINIDTEVKENASVDAYIGTENEQAGALCGEDAAKHLPDGGKVLILECPTINSINERIRGFETAISNKGFEIVARADVHGERESAKTKAAELLKQYPDVDVIMCGNDQSALGANDAAFELEERRDIRIYGVDGSPDLKKELKKGGHRIAGTAAQLPINIGKDAVKTAFQILAGDKTETSVYEETFLITEENIDMYGVDGWQ